MDTKALRQKIFDLAIRGKLVPQDPNDEPASVLLERIREQKKQMVKEGKLKAKDIKNDSIIFVGEDNLHYEKFTDGNVKCIEDEIPFELPSGWAWARIFSITEDLPYGTAKKSTQTGLVAVLRMGNIQSGEIDYSDLVYSSDADDIEKYTLVKNDLLFNRTNSAEWVGKTAIYRGNIPAIYAGYLIRVRTFINPEYLNVVMNSGYAKDYCNLVKTDGVNQSNINAQKLGNFIVPIPSLEEQRRISSSIIKTIPRISTIQKGKDHIADLIQQTKAKILDLAIRGQLVPQNPADEPASVLLERIRAEKEELIKQGKIKCDKKESIIFKGEDNSYYLDEFNEVTLPFDIPDNWIWVSHNELYEISGGSQPPKSKFSDIMKENYIRLYQIRDYGEHPVPVYIPEKLAAKKTKKGDILLARYGASLGKVFWAEDGAYNVAMAKVEAKFLNGILPEYMFYFYHSRIYKECIFSISRTAQAGFNKEDLNNLYIPLPPEAEQKRIVDILDNINSVINNISNDIFDR